MRPRRKAPIRQPKKQQSNSESWSRLLILFASAAFLFWLMASRSENSFFSGFSFSSLKPSGVPLTGSQSIDASATSAAALDSSIGVSAAVANVEENGNDAVAFDGTTANLGFANNNAASALGGVGGEVENSTAASSDANELAAATAARVLETKAKEEAAKQAAEKQHQLHDGAGRGSGATTSGADGTVQKKRRRRKWRGPTGKWVPVNGSFAMVGGKPKRRRLNTNINKDSLKRVFLDANRFGVEDLEPEVPPLEASKGSPCPEFDFGYEGFPGIASCWKAPIEDLMDTPTMYPSNCPNLDKSCVQETDFQPHQKWAAQVLVLHNVYVNIAGQVFNRTHFFDHNSCTANQPFQHSTAKTRVIRYKELVSLVDWFAWNARTYLLNILPLLVSLDSVLPYMRGVPTAFGHRSTQAKSQLERMVGMGSFEFLGVRLERLNPQIITDDDLFFAEKLILPLHQRCGRPSRALWQFLRSRYLLPPNGLPLYRQGVAFHDTYRKRRDRADDFQPGDNWVVLLGMREERKALVETIKLQQQLMRWFPSERIVVYREGSLPLLKKKELLNRARLLIAVHDNLLADMVFMPPGAAVFEIRLQDDPDPTFHHLAEACGLEYFLMFAEGTRGNARKAARMHVKDPKAVHRLIQQIGKKVKAKVA